MARTARTGPGLNTDPRLTRGAAFRLGRNRFLQSVLFEIEPLDPLTFASVALILAAAVLLASAIPARQASRTDAMKALRYE